MLRRKGEPLGRSLYFYDVSLGIHDKVRININGNILSIVKIEEWAVIVESHTNGRHWREEAF